MKEMDTKLNDMLNEKVLQEAEEELVNFNMEFENGTPVWYIMTQCAKYEFMLRVDTEMHNMKFDEDECLAILSVDNFLERCWETWTADEDGIEETIEFVTEQLVMDRHLSNYYHEENF